MGAVGEGNGACHVRPCHRPGKEELLSMTEPQNKNHAISVIPQKSEVLLCFYFKSKLPCVSRSEIHAKNLTCKCFFT